MPEDAPVTRETPGLVLFMEVIAFFVLDWRGRRTKGQRKGSGGRIGESPSGCRASQEGDTYESGEATSPVRSRCTLGPSLTQDFPLLLRNRIAVMLIIWVCQSSLCWRSNVPGPLA